MALTAGTRFGSFEIIGLIGAGGMGEVYRARDTALGRDVALKILPDQLTGDRERLARFEREARTLASLNHPHIAQVYGWENAAPSRVPGLPACAIVMEFVHGEDLSDRMASRPMPLDEVVSIAGQVADAIAAAHDTGIVHRDLKPSNIRIRSDGVVKVLDFGLAKPGEAGPGAVISATTTGVTEAHGVVLGTAAYMSPEQARGQTVDARSDIWAFGCVVYEMLTGRQAFSGATTSDTIARVLEREPDWDALPASTPAGLRRLLTRCLVKDPKRRLHALADAHFELHDALAGDANAGPPPRAAAANRVRRRWTMLAAVTMVVLGAAALWLSFGQPGGTLPPPQVLSLTSYPGVEATPTFSPDGRQIAFSWDGDRLDNDDIYVTIVGSDQPHRVTTDPARDVSPVWKPDGSQIAFARLDDTRTSIYVAAALGGSEQRLAEFPAHRTSSAPRGTGDPFLSWSPDGRWLAVSRVTVREASPTGKEGSAVHLVAHDGSERRMLLPSTPGDYTAAAFSPTGNAVAYAESGHIGVVEIEPGNPSVITRGPRRLTSFLGYIAGLAWTLDGKEVIYGQAAYAAPSPSYLWRVAADATAAPQRLDLSGVAGFPAVSPSGHRMAYSRRDLDVDLWLLREGREREPVAVSTFSEFDASFSPDGNRIAFASDRTGEGNEIWIVNSDGTGRRSVTRGRNRPEGSPRWSPDGRRLAYDGLGEDGQRHVYIVDEAGGEIRQVEMKPGSSDHVPSWSRDGKWLYFGSDRTGQNEIWRVPADGGEARQLTRDGGGVPFESWDGSTLYFLKSSGSARSVFAMPREGGRARPLGIDVTFWNYFPGERGVYYTSLPAGRRAPFSYEVRLLDGSGKTTVLHRVRLASMNPGLSTTPDGRTVLIAGAAEHRQDLLRIENFR